MAILRYRLDDLGPIVNRTRFYAGLTATLAATYLGLVLLLGLTVGESNLASAVTITEHEPSRRSAIDAGGPAGVRGTGSYELEPVDGATRFTMSTHAEAHRFFKLTEPVFARMARRDLASSAEHLKDLLEADGAP